MKCTGQCWKFIESDYEDTCLSGCELKGKYKIIIPKEEQCTCKKHDPYCCHIHGSCPTCVKKEEPKQETLEEAAHKMLVDYGIKSMGQSIGVLKVKKLMVDMAQWQAERMYSEEEVLEIIALFVNDSPHNTKEWFEQFQKKVRRK